LREKKQVLFPVRLVPFEAIRDWECFDADAGKDSAREESERSFATLRTRILVGCSDTGIFHTRLQ
jgi:hypothetical protein